MSREDQRAAARARQRAEQVDTSETATASVGSTGSSRGRVSPPQFLREVRGELRKVAWPSRQEVVSYTITVLVVTAFLTLVVWGMDWVLRESALRFL